MMVIFLWFCSWSQHNLREVIYSRVNRKNENAWKWSSFKKRIDEKEKLPEMRLKLLICHKVDRKSGLRSSGCFFIEHFKLLKMIFDNLDFFYGPNFQCFFFLDHKNFSANSIIGFIRCFQCKIVCLFYSCRILTGKMSSLQCHKVQHMNFKRKVCNCISMNTSNSF